jgi:hypothetical protein
MGPDWVSAELCGWLEFGYLQIIESRIGCTRRRW